MTKAELSRKGKAIPLGQSLTPESAQSAEYFLARSGWNHMTRGGTFRDHPQGFGIGYELAIRATGSGWRVWSTVGGHVTDFDPCLGVTFERYASAPSYDMLKRKVERCILDAWAEIRRRFAVASVHWAAEYARKSVHFLELVETQEAIWGQSDYQSMTTEQAQRWRGWLDDFISNKLALPPSRQLQAYTGPFQIHYGGLVIYEGQTAFWIYPEDDENNECCMGDMLNAYSGEDMEGQFPDHRSEALYNLSHDFITNGGDFWAAYFGG